MTEFPVYGASLFGTALLKYLLKTARVFLYLFSFLASKTREIVDGLVNTYRNNFRKKENLQ